MIILTVQSVESNVDIVSGICTIVSFFFMLVSFTLSIYVNHSTKSLTQLSNKIAKQGLDISTKANELSQISAPLIYSAEIRNIAYTRNMTMDNNDSYKSMIVLSTYLDISIKPKKTSGIVKNVFITFPNKGTFSLIKMEDDNSGIFYVEKFLLKDFKESAVDMGNDPALRKNIYIVFEDVYHHLTFCMLDIIALYPSIKSFDENGQATVLKITSKIEHRYTGNGIFYRLFENADFLNYETMKNKKWSDDKQNSDEFPSQESLLDDLKKIVNIFKSVYLNS